MIARTGLVQLCHVGQRQGCAWPTAKLVGTELMLMRGSSLNEKFGDVMFRNRCLTYVELAIGSAYRYAVVILGAYHQEM